MEEGEGQGADGSARRSEGIEGGGGLVSRSEFWLIRAANEAAKASRRAQRFRQ